MRRQLHSATGGRRSAARRGFTLVEMLTVIGIIVLLLSILLPVVGSVRQKAHAADTAALLNNLAAGIQRYHADFNAYPGPIHNGQIYGGTGAGTLSITIRNPAPGQTALVAAKITQSENLVLGLLGGLAPGTSTSTSAPPVVYDPQLIGNGPMSLNSQNPKKYQAYMDRNNLSAGHFVDDASLPDGADDSVIPEFLDRFPDAMPVLYLRAKAGAPTGATGTSGSPAGGGTLIVTNNPAYALQGQYDVRQILAYTSKNIGVGRDLPQSEYKGAAIARYTANKHGLMTAERASSMLENPPRPTGETRYDYPYDLYAYLRHPSIPNTPRSKDGFILISAGADRVYGTKDDIQQPPFR